MTSVLVAHSLESVDEIAKRLDEILKLRGLKKRELSRRAGVTEVQVDKIIQRGGKRAAGTTLEKIATAAGINIQWLLTGEGPRDREIRVEYNERYPNRAEAIRRVGDQVRPEAVKLVASLELRADEDHSVAIWIRRLFWEHDRITAEEANPQLAADRRARSDARIARIKAEDEAHFAKMKEQDKKKGRKG